jgi:hypothetical protein
MTETDHQALFAAFHKIMDGKLWQRLGEIFQPDATFEYPQSGERFTGLARIRAQFEEYPGMDTNSAELKEVLGGTTYALTPSYTIVGVEGSGARGTALLRVRYPDGTMWWLVGLYELREGRIGRMRAFFAPEFEPPDWRLPLHDPA